MDKNYGEESLTPEQMISLASKGLLAFVTLEQRRAIERHLKDQEWNLK